MKTRTGLVGIMLLSWTGAAEAKPFETTPSAAAVAVGDQNGPQAVDHDAAQTQPHASVKPDLDPANSSPITVTYSLGLATDNSSRGTSQMGGRPVVQAGVEVAGSHFYTGALASNVNFDDGTKAGIDLYTGVRGQNRGIDWDLRALAYAYVGQPDGSEYNYVELRASGAKRIGRATLGAVVYYAPDHFGTTSDPSAFFQLTGAYQVNPRWTLSSGLGRQWVPGPRDHTTWHFGPTYNATEHLSVDLRYYDTDSHDYGSNYDSRVVLGVKALF